MSSRLISILLILLITFSNLNFTSLCKDSIKSTNSSPTTLLFSSPIISVNYDIPLGCILVTISKGVFLVLLFIELLYANSAYANTISQLLGLIPTKHLNKLPKLLFTTSVYPYICGWNVELNFNLVPIFLHKVFQK